MIETVQEHSATTVPTQPRNGTYNHKKRRSNHRMRRTSSHEMEQSINKILKNISNAKRNGTMGNEDSVSFSQHTLESAVSIIPIPEFPDPELSVVSDSELSNSPSLSLSFSVSIDHPNSDDIDSENEANLRRIAPPSPPPPPTPNGPQHLDPSTADLSPLVLSNESHPDRPPITPTPTPTDFAIFKNGILSANKVRKSNEINQDQPPRTDPDDEKQIDSDSISNTLRTSNSKTDKMSSFTITITEPINPVIDSAITANAANTVDVDAVDIHKADEKEPEPTSSSDIPSNIASESTTKPLIDIVDGIHTQNGNNHEPIPSKGGTESISKSPDICPMDTSMDTSSDTSSEDLQTVEVVEAEEQTEIIESNDPNESTQMDESKESNDSNTSEPSATANIKTNTNSTTFTLAITEDVHIDGDSKMSDGIKFRQTEDQKLLSVAPTTETEDSSHSTTSTKVTRPKSPQISKAISIPDDTNHKLTGKTPELLHPNDLPVNPPSSPGIIAMDPISDALTVDNHKTEEKQQSIRSHRRVDMINVEKRQLTPTMTQKTFPIIPNAKRMALIPPKSPLSPSSPRPRHSKQSTTRSLPFRWRPICPFSISDQFTTSPSSTATNDSKDSNTNTTNTANTTKTDTAKTCTVSGYLYEYRFDPDPYGSMKWGLLTPKAISKSLEVPFLKFRV